MFKRAQGNYRRRGRATMPWLLGNTPWTRACIRPFQLPTPHTHAHTAAPIRTPRHVTSLALALPATTSPLLISSLRLAWTYRPSTPHPTPNPPPIAQTLSLDRCDQVGNAGVSALTAPAPTARSLPTSASSPFPSAAAAAAAPPPPALASLSSLSLAYTGVTTAGITGLTALTALTSLNLDSCGVGDAACRVGGRVAGWPGVHVRVHVWRAGCVGARGLRWLVPILRLVQIRTVHGKRCRQRAEGGGAWSTVFGMVVPVLGYADFDRGSTCRAQGGDCCFLHGVQPSASAPTY